MSYEIVNIYILPHAQEFGLLCAKDKSSAVGHCTVFYWEKQLAALGIIKLPSRDGGSSE